MADHPELRGIREARAFDFEDIDVRAGEPNPDGSIPFKGHAAVFNRKADIGGWFTEEIAPGAFTKTLREADVRMLMNHDMNMPLARSKAGSLRLSEDKRGLAVEADMVPTTYANDLALLMDRGVVNEMSFSFAATREQWDETPKVPHRTVLECRLFDVAPVTMPAYAGTDASLRSAEFGALLAMLGLDEVSDEQRSLLLLQVRSGDVAPEFAQLLRAAQVRFASFVPVAAPDGAPQGEAAAPLNEHPASRTLSSNLARRRMSLHERALA